MTNVSAVFVGLTIAFVFSWELGFLGFGLCLSILILAILNVKVANASRKRKELEDQSGEVGEHLILSKSLTVFNRNRRAG